MIWKALIKKNIYATQGYSFLKGKEFSNLRVLLTCSYSIQLLWKSLNSVACYTLVRIRIFLITVVEASNVINDPKCNKGPKCNNFWP